MQSFLKLCIIISTFSWLGFVPLTIAKQDPPTYIYHICDNATSFTVKSAYQANLNQLLSSLNSTNNHAFTNGFDKTTVGTGNSTVYGLFLCRGDLNSSACRNCVSFASADVIQRCPVEKEALIWYDECMLRYSNKSFISQMTSSQKICLCNPTNVSQPDSFNALLDETMNTTATEAADTKRRFATEKTNSESLYTLTQCTQDITGSDCDKCLGDAIKVLPTCCGGKQGGRLLTPSCNIRYEIYPFYETATSSPPRLAPTPTPASTPTPTPTPILSPTANPTSDLTPTTTANPTPAPTTPRDAASKGGSQVLSVTIMAIVVPVIISVKAVKFLV